MSAMLQILFGALSQAVGEVSLSGTAGYNFVDGGLVVCSTTISNDGTLLQDGQSDATWIEPTSAAPADYEARFTNVTGTAISSQAAEDEWWPLASGDLIIRTTRAGAASPGSTNGSFWIEIRKNGGAVLATAAFSNEAEN